MTEETRQVKVSQCLSLIQHFQASKYPSMEFRVDLFREPLCKQLGKTFVRKAGDHFILATSSFDFDSMPNVRPVARCNA